MALKFASKSSPASPIGEQGELPLSELNFDTHNPRLVEYGNLSDLSEPDHIKLLWKRMAVDEVLLSVATDGFWSYEPLIVCKEDGNWVVIEGNRRLAAAKILLSPKLQKDLAIEKLPALTDEMRQTLDPLPVMKIDKRQDVWRYLGFKHVNGPAKWRSYAKAQYIAFVRKTAKPKPTLAEIAQQIGDRHGFIERLDFALSLLERVERAKTYHRIWCYGSRICLVNLIEALSLDGIRDFLKVSSRSGSKSRRERELARRAGELCTWLWGDHRSQREPVLRSCRIDELAAIISNDSGLSALRGGSPPVVALALARGGSKSVHHALEQAFTGLSRAIELVSRIRRAPKESVHLARRTARLACDVATVAAGKSFMRRRTMLTRGKIKSGNAR